jgi:hypothetical protein
MEKVLPAGYDLEMDDRRDHGPSACGWKEFDHDGL